MVYQMFVCANCECQHETPRVPIAVNDPQFGRRLFCTGCAAAEIEQMAKQIIADTKTIARLREALYAVDRKIAIALDTSTDESRAKWINDARKIIELELGNG